MAKFERTKNATRNIAWGIMERMLAVIFPFISRTVLIKVLGAEYLGLNSLFTSILQVLSISELGIGTAIVFSMYRPIAEDDEVTVCALLNFYRKIYYLIGTIILVCGLLIVPFLPRLIKGDVPNGISIYVLYFMYLANTVVSFYLFAYKQALFSAYQRNDLISKRAMIISTTTQILQIILLLIFKNYYIYVIVIPLSTVVTNLANAYLAKKMFPKLKCAGAIPDDLKESLKRRIIGLVSFKIYGVIFTSVDTIVISAFLGLTQLAIYNNYYYIQTSIIGFLTIFTASITAGVGNKMVTNSKVDNYEDFKRLTFANGWLSSWCAVCLLCLYQHFMTTWVGPELTFATPTMVLMVVYFLLPRITTMTFTYREAAGLWWEDRIRPLVSAVVNIVVNIVLVKIIGINGVIISTLLCTVCINIPWGSIILFKNYFKISPKEYFLKIIFYVVTTGIVGGVTYFICAFLPSIGWLYLFLKGAICVIVPNMLFYCFYRNKKEFLFFSELLHKMKDKVVEG